MFKWPSKLEQQACEYIIDGPRRKNFYDLRKRTKSEKRNVIIRLRAFLRYFLKARCCLTANHFFPRSTTGFSFHILNTIKDWPTDLHSSQQIT